MKSVDIHFPKKIRILFLVLLLQSVIFEIWQFSFFPVISFPKFRGDEFNKDVLAPKINSAQDIELLKSIYPHDKRYYLFIQRALEDTTKAKSIYHFLRLQR